MLKRIVEYIIRELVDSPEMVSVVESTEDGRTKLDVRVAKDDLGKIIGKGGQTIRSIRSMAYVLAPKGGCEIKVDADS